MKPLFRSFTVLLCLIVLLSVLPGPAPAKAAALSTDLGNFESGTDGWQWGSNVAALSNVTSSLNGPTTPFEGSRMGELTSTAVPGTTWRSIYRNFASALNMTSTPYFHGAFNTYGINSSHTQFEVRLTFYSNAQTFVSTQNIGGNQWNELTVNLSGWSYVNNITKIEIAYRSVTYTSNWTAKHQLDNVGFMPVPVTGAISQVSADATQISVQGSYPAAASVQFDLIELQTYESYNSSAAYTAQATQTVAPSGGTASFNLTTARYASSRDKAYPKFAVIDHATKALVAAPAYLTQLTSSANTYAFPTAKTIKGLQVQMVDDAQKLGIGHAALNVSFNEMFMPDATNAIPFVMDGTTYYFSQSYIGGLDHDIKTLSDDDIIVSLILLMYNASGTINAKLIHPDYSGAGTVAAVNATNADGVRYWKAGVEFLASRYTRSDELYGRAVNYIVGNEVDSQIYWYDMGSKTLQDFVEQYSRTFRITNTAIKKYYSNARTYISLDHFWNGSVGSNPLQTYKGKDLLDEFNRRIASEGNIGWNIAYHPYPEDLFDPTTWNDTTATDSPTTTRITSKNLQVLTDYIGASNYLYNGNKRRVILSEQGFHSLSNSAADQQTQAAAYAYAYYKARFTDGIDAFILHRHVDHGGEGGLNLGLWTRDPSKSAPAAPLAQKAMYNVFKKIDTSESVSVTAFAKSIIGIANWSDAIPSYNASLLDNGNAPVAGVLSSAASISPTLSVSGFESSADGWAISEYAQSAAVVSSFANGPTTPYAGSKALEVNTNNSLTGDYEGGARAEKGITKVFASPVNATSAPKFQFAIDSYGAAPGATSYQVTVRIYSGTHVIQGIASTTPDSWNKFSMDISGWAYKGSIDKIKIWHSANSTSIWNGRYQVDQIGFGV